MYVTASAITDVNQLKYQLLQAKKGAMESCQLPPCAGFLYLHWPECYLLFYEEKTLEKHYNTPGIKPGYGGLMDSAQFINRLVAKTTRSGIDVRIHGMQMQQNM